MSEPTPVCADRSGPLSVVALFSGGASGVRYLLDVDRHNGTNYEIAAGIADSREIPGIEVLNKGNVPVEIILDRAGTSGGTGDNETGSDYFREVTEAVDRYEPDIVLLSGFMRIVREPLLSEYRGRIFNVHPADLRLKEGGSRKYRGTDTVYRAIVSGEEEIRSTVHLVTAGVDEGPLLVVSEPLPINREIVRTFEKFDESMIRTYADLVQEWMKWACDGPAIKKTLELFATGRIGLDRGEVYLKDETGFKNGYYDLERDEIVSERTDS